MYSIFSYSVLLLKLLQFTEKIAFILENFFKKVQFYLFSIKDKKCIEFQKKISNKINCNFILSFNEKNYKKLLYLYLDDDK